MGRGRGLFSGGTLLSSGGRGSNRSSSHSRTRRRRGVVIVGGGVNTKATLFFAAILILFVGVCSIYGAISAILTKDDYKEVVAICVDNTYSDGWYYTTYEYVVDDINYENISVEGWEYPERLGKEVIIYYLISDPNIITEKDPVGNIPALIIVGIVLFAAGGYILFLAIKYKKNNEEGSNVEEYQEVKEELNNEKYIVCSYCGGKFKYNLESCPHCGAARK